MFYDELNKLINEINFNVLSGPWQSMAESDDKEAEFVQFVYFKTAGQVPVDLFQHSWIPVAEEFFTRGINKIILSEKLPLSGDLSPCKFVSRNYWASLTAVKGTFPGGLPPPCSRGHITVSQVLSLKGLFQTSCHCHAELKSI